MPEPYRIRVSTERTDPAWDQLVLAAGTYEQSCAWAIARTTLGWRMGRVVLEADGQLIGGGTDRLAPIVPCGCAVLSVVGWLCSCGPNLCYSS